MSLFSPLLIVCLDQDEAAAVSELARALGYPDAHIVEGGFQEAVHALHLRTSSPDYLIVDIGDAGAEVLPALDDFAQHCEASVRVAIIGSVNDIEFYRELRRRGVLEYFNRPVKASDVRPVLIQARGQSLTAAPSSQQGHVISFMSAASGDGASTLALNFAYTLAERFRQPTVLVDMDYQFGLIAKSLDLAAPFGVRELFDHPDRGLDHVLVNKMLVKYRDALSIIAAPSELRLLPVIRPEIIRELVTILRSQFTFVVIDIPHVWTDWTAAALTYSDHSVMVAQLWLRSLTHASRLLTAWNHVGIDRDGVSLVINRSGAKFKEAVDAEDFERICRHKIDAYIDNDVKAITDAENNAITLLESEQGAALQRQVEALARQLAARYVGDEALGEAPKSGGKKSLLARIGKK